MALRTHIKLLSLLACSLLALSNITQAANTSGTLIAVSAHGEVKHANDQAQLIFTIDEQDKSKAAAASRVNQKMKQATELLKRLDPSATLETRGYYTYPIYPEDTPTTTNRGQRQATSWRVGQSLEVSTRQLSDLPKTVAAVQDVIGLSNINFSLSEQTRKNLDQSSIKAAYQHLNERINAIASSLGRNPADATIEVIDFEGAGRETDYMATPRVMMAAAPMMREAKIETPSLEPGETTVSMRLVGKIRFK